MTCGSLSRHHIIDTAFLDIAQHICEYMYFACFCVCVNISQCNGVYCCFYGRHKSSKFFQLFVMLFIMGTCSEMVSEEMGGGGGGGWG